MAETERSHILMLRQRSLIGIEGRQSLYISDADKDVTRPNIVLFNRQGAVRHPQREHQRFSLRIRLDYRGWLKHIDMCDRQIAAQPGILQREGENALRRFNIQGGFFQP